MATPPKKTTGKTLEDFRATHDKSFVVPNKIKAGLEKLGPNNWEYELEFSKLAEVGLPDLGTFRDQFEDFWFVLPGRNPKRVWAGSKALATKMREMV